MLNHLLRQVLLLFVCGGIYFSVHGQKYLHKKVLHTVLWKISGQGLTNPSFLFGVDHVQAYEPFVKKYPQLDSVMAFCETLIVENIPTSGGEEWIITCYIFTQTVV
ncbi:TraB/GumN family protein [Arachidicoccus ginsenosidivorans]|uniref:TraB/GumN family protein n=1 Tax=Arachidicoccus ginsenosidivorans TaxID=496057 RepID=A0A5B8VLK2_9BACT|nr:TraB/GumN family protein [Arachidicoccus ginsenosidivorans]QEC71108.1 TraB/GumN family protein [Arachidicoccus ginsenosidivorans]